MSNSVKVNLRDDRSDGVEILVRTDSSILISSRYDTDVTLGLLEVAVAEINQRIAAVRRKQQED